MADEKTYTEREMALHQQKAFLEGAAAFNYDLSTAVAHRIAGLRYPLPKVTRARVVPDDRGCQWKWEDGRLWKHIARYALWEEMFGESASAAIRDVILNPTEEVDDA